MMTRRNFLQRGGQLGLAAATRPLWGSLAGTRALAQVTGSDYKAIVVITLIGGNDGNNLLVPMDSATYRQYSAVRGPLALPLGSLNPLASTPGSPFYGLHPSLQNIAAMYNKKRALVVANVGPIAQPATKASLFAGTCPTPFGMYSHNASVSQWESSETVSQFTTGWGGRIGDLIANRSGALSPMLNAGLNSLFTVGSTVQAIAVQAGDLSFPPAMNATVVQMAQQDSTSANQLIAQSAKFRATAMQDQVLITQASQYAPTKTAFPSSTFGSQMKAIVNLISGRSVIGAKQQVFYTRQGGYDTHGNQLPTQGHWLQDLDNGLGSFFAALDEIGMSNQVLVCTHSDFSRSATANVDNGSDHGWANHQLVLGGGISGGRVIGSLPDFELGGVCDIGQQGVWIPTTSITQLTASVGSWFGLNSGQVADVFPELANFPAGAIQLT